MVSDMKLNEMIWEWVMSDESEPSTNNCVGNWGKNERKYHLSIYYKIILCYLVVSYLYPLSYPVDKNQYFYHKKWNLCYSMICFVIDISSDPNPMSSTFEFVSARANRKQTRANHEHTGALRADGHLIKGEYTWVRSRLVPSWLVGTS